MSNDDRIARLEQRLAVLEALVRELLARRGARGDCRFAMDLLASPPS